MPLWKNQNEILSARYLKMYTQNQKLLYSFYYWIFLFLYHFDKNKIFQLPRLVQTDSRKDDSCKWFHYQVIYASIKNEQFAFSHKFLSRPGFWTQNFKDSWLSIKSPAKHLVFFIWLTIDSNLKLLHTEIVPLWIKTIVNFSQFLKPYLW